MKKWIDDNLRKKFIRPSQSEAASPILLIKKPGGGVRICVDYRGINNVTTKTRHPLQLIKETLDAICKAKIFTKLDVIAAFNRIRVKEGHEWLIAFITRFGLFESLVCPFGLQGAPGTFQNYINDVLHDILDIYATAYLDDILVYSENEEEHVSHVKEVLNRMIKAGLQIDIDKCKFHTQRTKYLGLIITPGGIEMDSQKVSAVISWEAPDSKRTLQRFLGFANFYHRFIKHFSIIAGPLYELTKKTEDWHWNSQHQKSFETLKKAFSSGPVLRIYDWAKRTVVETDASNWACGGTLSQYDDEGILRPVAYFSQRHSSAECNYDIYDKELLAIIKALEEWDRELAGAQQPFEVLTDHKGLKSFTVNKQLTPRHMRWSQFLSRFNFTIQYRPGSLQVRPDALSRKPEDIPKDEADERLLARNKVLLDQNIFVNGAFVLSEAGRNEAFVSSACICELEVMDEKSTEDLVTESYEKSVLLQDIVASLSDPGRKAWSKEVKEHMKKVSFAECRALQGRAYYRGAILLDPNDTELQL